MIDADKQLLAEFDYGIISADVFLKRFSVDIKKDFDFIRSELQTAIKRGEPDDIQMIISLIWLTGKSSEFLDLLNELLINPNHRNHQQIAKALQDIASPTTIPFVRKALESNFDYVEYTCSESGVIAKWFSWLLSSIGNKDAINLIEEFSSSSNEGIRNEMLYRLRKLER